MSGRARRPALPALLAVLVLALPTAVPGAAPRDDEPGGRTARDPLQVDELTRMVAAGHRFLLEHQNPDGSFSVTRNEESAKSAPVAVTGLATLSLLAGGLLPPREGEHGTRALQIKRAVDWLVAHCDEEGRFQADDDTVSKMHGQGYALLALTQAVGMYGDSEPERQRIHDAIRRGVALIQASQGLQGGWFYEARISAAHEGSITVCMIQALRAAKDAGFAVDTGVIDKALEYMRKSQDEVSGRFKYSLGSDQMSWALTAAALSTLNALGEYDGAMHQAGFDALVREDPFLSDHKTDQFLLYGAFYAAQSYWAHRDPRLFRQWWPEYVAWAANLQRPDEGFFPNGQYGSIYATAIVTLTLQVPLGYLPLFQR